MKRKRFMMEQYPASWSRLVRRYPWLPTHQKRIDFIHSFKDSIGHAPILDCGGGTGYPFAQKLLEKGWRVVNQDISKELLLECQRELHQLGSQEVLGDAEGLPFRDQAFPLVYCFQSTPYFPNINDAIKEMLRVLSQDGLLIFDIENVLNPNSLYNYSKRRLRHLLGKAKHLLVRKSHHSVVHQTPSFLLSLGMLLKRQGVSFYITPPHELEPGNRPPLWRHLFSFRLIFVCQKPT